VTLDLRLHLRADGPAAWLEEHLAARGERWRAGLDPADVEVVTLAGVVADGAAVLRRSHERLVAEGTPAPAAATYLADWFAGSVAGAVGYGLATAGAGFLLDRPEVRDRVRLHLHPDGWVMDVELPPRAAVTADHPWAGAPGAVVVGGAEEVVARAVDALVDAVRDVIGACHGLATVGRAGLWNEVGDGLGTALAHQDDVPVTDPMLDVLRVAVERPGVPWRARPDLALADSELAGRVHVVRKGGCCLAYTRPAEIVPDADDPDLDEEHRAFLRRFPDPPGTPRWCTTCSLRTMEDSTARQVWWRERQRA